MSQVKVTAFGTGLPEVIITCCHLVSSSNKPPMLRGRDGDCFVTVFNSRNRCGFFESNHRRLVDDSPRTLTIANLFLVMDFLNYRIYKCSCCINEAMRGVACSA